MELVIAGSIPVMHPSEDTAKLLATGLENQGTGNCKGSIPSSSFSYQIRLIVPIYCRDTAAIVAVKFPGNNRSPAGV